MQYSHSLDTVLLYSRRSVPVLVDMYHEHRSRLVTGSFVGQYD